MAISKATIDLLKKHSSSSSYPKCLQDWSFVIHISKPQHSRFFSSVTNNRLHNCYFYVSKYDGKVIVINKIIPCNETHEVQYSERQNNSGTADLDDGLYWLIKDFRSNVHIKLSSFTRHDDYYNMCDYAKLCQLETLHKKINILTKIYKLKLWRSESEIDIQLKQCRKDIYGENLT
tara:strand:+ start:111 stop:638 length:528 start_codon:yes stop_codon:yes gene_type:complete